MHKCGVTGETRPTCVREVVSETIAHGSGESLDKFKLEKGSQALMSSEFGTEIQ
jgi:hypothetical protein